MLEVPAATPVITPVPAFTAALEANALDQVPSAGIAPSADVLPTHTASEPLIAPGTEFTVITTVAAQPEAKV
jgi:hypothetical protein